MIPRLFALLRQISFRQLVRNPRAEMGRILAALGRRLEGVGRRVGSGRRGAVPAWLHEEINAQAHIETQLLGRDRWGACHQQQGTSVVSRPGEIYRELVAEVGGQRASHVLVVPWLVRGGADRGALYHLQAWADAFPQGSALLILTEDVASPWLDRVPAGIRVLSFGRIVGSMGLHGRVQLLTRLMVQMQPDVIHTINSPVAWEAIKLYGRALRQSSRLFASLFCDDQSDDGVPIGYARSYLRDCCRHLTAVFCDNSVYPGVWARELGVPRQLFTVLRFPYDRPVVRKDDAFAVGTLPRVLWAGRFVRQKRPDILLAIAKAMPAVAFDVHGVSELGHPDPSMKALKALPNVRLHGSFARFEDIVEPDHAAYLFTTSWEGVPTILLDAFAVGLPVVAPDVGGIADLLPPSSLVEDLTDAMAYVRQLQWLIDDPALRRARRLQQYDALAVDRDWDSFIQILRHTPLYLPETPVALAHLNEQGRAS